MPPVIGIMSAGHGRGFVCGLRNLTGGRIRLAVFAHRKRFRFADAHEEAAPRCAERRGFEARPWQLRYCSSLCSASIKAAAVYALFLQREIEIDGDAVNRSQPSSSSTRASPKILEQLLLKILRKRQAVILPPYRATA